MAGGFDPGSPLEETPKIVCYDLGTLSSTGVDGQWSSATNQGYRTMFDYCEYEFDCEDDQCMEFELEEDGSDDPDPEYEQGDVDDFDSPMDGDMESGLASAGFGTDEDYDHFESYDCD